MVAHLQGEPSSGTFSFKGDRTVEDNMLTSAGGSHPRANEDGRT